MPAIKQLPKTDVTKAQKLPRTSAAHSPEGQNTELELCMISELRERYKGEGSVVHKAWWDSPLIRIGACTVGGSALGGSFGGYLGAAAGGILGLAFAIFLAASGK